MTEIEEPISLAISEIPDVVLTKEEKKRKYAREYMNKRYKDNKDKYSRERLTNYYLKENKLDKSLYDDYGTHASTILRALNIIKTMEDVTPMKYLVDEINKLIDEASIQNDIICNVIEQV